MRSIRRHWWAALSAAVLVAGCSNESSDATAPSPTTPPAATASGAKPNAETKAPEPTPAEPKADADKKPDDGAKPDMPKIEGPKIEGPKIEAPKADADKKADAAVKLTDDEIAAIKKLPAEDQTVALSQGVCPVSGEHLGAMGAPVKVSAEGKSLFICCKSCKKKVDADPKAILAKLAGK